MTMFQLHNLYVKTYQSSTYAGAVEALKRKTATVTIHLY